MVPGSILGPRRITLGQVRKKKSYFWRKYNLITRCGKEFNTPSCWSNLDQEACNNYTADNNNTVENNDDTSDNIATSNFNNLSEPLLYYNSSCWYPNHLFYR